MKGEEATDLLKDLLITLLGSAGVKQQAIRKIVGCNMYRVNRIVKHLKTKANESKNEGR